MANPHRTARRPASRRGILTFEWILLLTLLVIGIVGGLAATRNALLRELGDLSHGVEALNACPHDHDGPSDDDGDGPPGLDPDHDRGHGHAYGRGHGQGPWWETTGD